MKNKIAIKLLEELTQLDAVSSDEVAVSAYLKNKYAHHDMKIEHDNLGSIAISKVGDATGPKIMLAGHMDEIGFMVKKVEDTGYLRMQPIGGWWSHVLLSQLMSVKTQDNKSYVGVIGSKAPHGLPPEVKNKVMELKDLFLDIGATDKAMVESLGIKVGDIISPKSEFTVLADGRSICAKAFDNRVGVGALVQTLDYFQDKSHPNTIVAVGTVQEEVGLRGATTAANLVKPDIAIAVDVTLATDMPGESQELKCHEGVAISLLDGSIITHRGLLNFVQEVATEHNIKFQYDMMTAGGTDAGAIHKSNEGVPTLVLSIPARYIHSHRGVISVEDYVAAVDLINAICEKLDSKALETIKNYYR